MLKRVLIVLLGLPLLACATAAASQPVQIHLGMADLDAILDGSKAIPLIEPKIEFEPAYKRGVTSYSVPVLTVRKASHSCWSRKTSAPSSALSI